jgi:hypothetical protein
VLRLGAAPRTADEARDPGPQINRFACHFLHGLLTYLMLRGLSRPRGGSPAFGVPLRDATRWQPRLALQADVILASSAHLRQDLARGMLHGMPQPARGRLALHVTHLSSRAAGSPRRRASAVERQTSPSTCAGGRPCTRGSCTCGSAGAFFSCRHDGVRPNRQDARRVAPPTGLHRHGAKLLVDCRRWPRGAIR